MSSAGSPSPVQPSPLRDRALLGATIGLFGVFTAFALLADGISGIPDAITYNWVSVQIFLDLVIAIVLVAVWMHRDARQLGRNPWPWILACPFVGVFSPLGYLITRSPAAKQS